MLVSLIFAWLSVVLAALTSVKYIVRRLGSRELNRSFSRGHKLIGWLLIPVGLIHGVLAGNAAGLSLNDIIAAPILFTINWGTACFTAVLLLALSYILRKHLKKYWMPIHRVLTALLVVLVVIHVLDTGISIDNRIASLVSGSISETAAKNSPAPEVNFSGAVLEDGTYEGSASGFNGAIEVYVTVSDGQVTDITVINENETGQFFSRAETVLDTIIGGQSLEVDTVSGATYSSAGLINAVSDALQSAVLSGELKVTEIDLSSVRRHR